MNAYYKLSIAILLVLMMRSACCLAQNSTNSTVSDASVIAAINTLKTNKPLSSNPWGAPGPTNAILGSGNMEKYQQYLKIYNSQLSAITVVGNAKIPSTAPLLLPYLDYCTSSYQATCMTGVPNYFILQVWPVLPALQKTPGSSQALADFAVDEKNPIPLRFAAFHVLSYVDKKKLRSVGDVLSTQFSHSKRALDTIRFLEEDVNHDQDFTSAHQYMGTVLFNDISK